MKKRKETKSQKKPKSALALLRFPPYLPSMPALPLPHNLIPLGGSPVFTRIKVENVDGGEVKVYFSRDTTKKLDQPTASEARGTNLACGIGEIKE